MQQKPYKRTFVHCDALKKGYTEIIGKSGKKPKNKTYSVAERLLERGSTMNINERICQLMIYAREAGLIQAEDDTYTVNRVLEVLKLDDFEEADVSAEGIYPDGLEEILKDLVDDAIARGVLKMTVL